MENKESIKEKLIKNKKIIIPVAIAIVIIVIIGIIFLININKNKIWKYIDKAEFEQAYNIAKSEDEKKSVIKANAIAYVTFLTGDIGGVDMTTAPIVINNAWYDSNRDIVISIRNTVKNEDNYILYSYSKSNKDYEVVCIFKNPVNINNITLADKYKSGIKSFTNSKSIQDLANTVLKQQLPDKLNRIMSNENRVVREINVTNYLIRKPELEKNIKLLEI